MRLDALDRCRRRQWRNGAGHQSRIKKPEAGAHSDPLTERRRGLLPSKVFGGAQDDATLPFAASLLLDGAAAAELMRVIIFDLSLISQFQSARAAGASWAGHAQIPALSSKLFTTTWQRGIQPANSSIPNRPRELVIRQTRMRNFIYHQGQRAASLTHRYAELAPSLGGSPLHCRNGSSTRLARPR